MDGHWFQDQLRRAGHTQAELARALGIDPSAVSKLFKGERQLKLVEASHLARFLNLPYEEVVRRAGVDQPPGGGVLPGGEAAATSAQTTTDQQRDLIPVRSAARGGDNQEMFLEDGPIDYVQRPPYLRNVRDAYGIYVVGDSMAPRYRQGQLLHVNPHRPAAPGRGVVVTRRDGAVLIKEFVRRTSDGLVLREYQPAEREFSVRANEVADVHVVAAIIED
jgi:phage repressor protein C with HTH and peptisase S24 domain